MKKIFLSLFVGALLISCSKEETQPNSTNESNFTANSISAREELDAPFKSFSYVKESDGTFTVTYEIPSNYSTKVTVEKDSYIIYLDSNTSDSPLYTVHNERLSPINGVFKVSFVCRGKFIKRPTVIVNI